jgi:hypothetical protein
MSPTVILQIYNFNILSLVLTIAQTVTGMKEKEPINMSQQHMEFDESQRERPGASYTAYEGVPPFNSYSIHPYGQKLSGNEISKTPTVG